MAFGLRRRGVKDVKKQVEDMLELVELTPMARRKPGQLSGGQQQRVAVARALINQPDVLLLDEPLGALDLKLRRQMQIELKRIQTEVGITFVHVTHDQEEAMTMADTVAVMNQGRIEQMGSPADIYENPRTAFVANFLGQSNLFPGTVVGRASGYDRRSRSHGSDVPHPDLRGWPPTGDSVVVGVRPEKVTIRATRRAPGRPTAATRSRAWSPTRRSPASPPSTSCAPPGARSCRSSRRTCPRTTSCASVTTSWCRWDPSHTFGLDGSEDLSAGVDKELLDARAASPGRDGAASPVGG